MIRARRIHWKDAFERPEVKKLWKYAAFIFMSGLVGKQLVWQLAQSHITEISDARHKEASENLEKAYEDGRRLAAMRRAKLIAQLEAEEEAKRQQQQQTKRRWWG